MLAKQHRSNREYRLLEGQEHTVSRDSPKPYKWVIVAVLKKLFSSGRDD